MSEQPEQERVRPRIEWLKVIAGALAAVSSAVLLSTLGAAGTLVGAALGSVIVSITSNVYSHGLERSRAQIAETQEIARQKLGLAQAEVRRAERRHDDTSALEAHLHHADEQLAEVRSEMATPPSDPSWRDRFVLLPWKRIAVVAGAFFVIAVLLITGFELIAGRPVSTYTGGTSGDHGTSFSRVGGGSSHKSKAKQTPTPTPTPSTSSSSSPSSSPSTSPTASPTEEPSVPNTPSPSVTPSPTATATNGG